MTEEIESLSEFVLKTRWGQKNNHFPFELSVFF